MLTTIRKLLEAKETSVQDTIYSTASADILDFPLSIGDFFELTEGGTGARDFEIWNNLYVLTETIKKNSEYETMCSELLQVTKRLKELKSTENITPELKAEKSELRKSKKKLTEKKTALEEKYCVLSKQEIQKKCGYGLNYLEYKGLFNCSYFSEVAAMLPLVAAVNTPKLKEMPLFVRNIGDLVQAVKSGVQLGIVGGPCLFGTHEVTIDVHHTNGTVFRFDFSTGRGYDKSNMFSKIDLESYFNTKYEGIDRLILTNFKGGVTPQEYLSIQSLFEFARILDAKVVIPIPDISYMKFFKGVTKLIADEVKGPAFKAFEKISHDIADMYLKVIEKLQAQYPEVEYQVLHSRNTNLCELFYTKRQRYIQQLNRLGRITVYNGKTDAIIDYITMLALPYYVYGTQNVLQIDSVDEADSMRKCIKIHSTDITFHSILYPEYLCKDGVHTIFNAPLELKDYISTGGKPWY
jgi:hypothetical protein